MILFFDTETTGLVNFKTDEYDMGQPRIVQLGAILTDEVGNELAVMDCLVKPEGFVIPENMVHGISQEKALKEGSALDEVLRTFNLLCTCVSKYVAHNIKFDKVMVNREYIGLGLPVQIPDGGFCTMLGSMNLVQAKQANGRLKWPRLQEAHKYFFGCEFDSAHDALADVRATKRIYFELMQRNKPNPMYVSVGKESCNPV